MIHYPVSFICRLLIVLAPLVLMAIVLPQAHAQDNYPSRPIRIIVPSAPGGSSDVGARLIAQRLSERWGRAVVENRAGAATIIGSELVAKRLRTAEQVLRASRVDATR